MDSTRLSYLAVRLLSLVLAACALAVPSGAVTRIVDASGGTPYTTIQSAINASLPGQDDVFVRCGLYPENVQMKDGVSLRGAGAHCTTIDARRLGSAVKMPVISIPTTIEGFTLQGAQGHVSAFGAGVEVKGGAPVIRDNVIQDNIGAGVFTTYAGSPTMDPAAVITRNVIRNNGICCSGGGIFLDPAILDSDAPEPGQAFFYLAAARSGATLGTLGFTSNHAERPRTLPCTEP